MNDLDARLGTPGEEGRPILPALDVNGQAYDPNGLSTLHLGGGFFVVLPRYGQADRSVLETLRARVRIDAPPLDDGADIDADEEA